MTKIMTPSLTTDQQIIRRVKVDRTRTPEATLIATGHKQYTNSSVVTNMPKGEGDEVEVFFFKLGRYVNNTDLDKEYELRGLKPADPYSQAMVNKVYPDFADKYPNATQWKDAQNKWCFATFFQWFNERRVGVGHNDDGCGVGFHDLWWFAGLRK